MLNHKLRRSTRLNGDEDPNGREYLADILSWPRHRLESWLKSPTVRPHLQLWYQLCISNFGRFNDATDWINTGEKGYFYCADDLEEDLLFMCLGEGNGGCDYADKEARTGLWITQEIWARTAWRIVQANAGEGGVFEEMVNQRPAGAYGFVIEVLCLVFHSIAHRGGASCYEDLINRAESKDIEGLPTDEARLDAVIVEEDMESVTSSSTVTESTETMDDNADSDFEGEKQSSRTSVPSNSPSKRKREASDGNCSARAVEEWMASQEEMVKDGADAGMAVVGEEMDQRCIPGFIFAEVDQRIIEK